MLPKALATVRRPLEQLCAYLFIRSLYPREDPANSLYGVDVSCLPPLQNNDWMCNRLRASLRNLRVLKLALERRDG